MEDIHHRLVLVSGGIKLGGSTTFLLNLAGELVRRGVSVLVVSLEHDNPYDDDFKRLGIPLHVEDERASIFEDRLSSALRIIRAFEPTAVIACLGPSSYEILRYVPSWVIRLAMVQSDYPGNYASLAPYTPFLDGAIGVSQQIQVNLRAHPVLGCVTPHYLPYGVITPQNAARDLRTRAEPIRVLYLGRLCRPQKRVHLFPEILRHIRAAEIQFQWTIAGDGPERPWLEKEMISSPLVRVQFPGAINYRDVPRLLDSHDVFLLASDAEGLPLSLLEAMAHGLVPVVSNLRSGVSEVVNQDCGILVDPDDIEGYAAGIIWLSQNPSDLQAMAARASQRVRASYSVAAMTDRWLALLNSFDKGHRNEWPQTFKVSGPLSQHSLWFGQPMRALRRVVRHLRGLPARL